MTEISLEAGLVASFILFIIGLAGVMVRRNIIFMLMSIEVMLNASGLAFIFAGAHWDVPDGQIMFIFILALAAAEVSVGLALIILIYRMNKILDIDMLKNMKG